MGHKKVLIVENGNQAAFIKKELEDHNVEVLYQHGPDFPNTEKIQIPKEPEVYKIFNTYAGLDKSANLPQRFKSERQKLAAIR